MLCQVANALSYPSQAAALGVIGGQITGRANGTLCSIKPSQLATCSKNQSTGLKAGEGEEEKEEISPKRLPIVGF